MSQIKPVRDEHGNITHHLVFDEGELIATTTPDGQIISSSRKPKPENTLLSKEVLAALLAVMAACIGVFSCGFVVNGTFDLRDFFDNEPEVIAETEDPNIDVPGIPSSTPINSTIESSTTQTPTSRTTASATVVSQRTSITVPGNASTGVIWECPETTEYSISLVEGAYSGWALNVRNDQWRTIIYIYINRELERGDANTVTWGAYAPVNPDGSVGSGDFVTKELAEASNSTRPPTVLTCNEGQYLRFLPIDNGNYADNVGSVEIGISY